MGLFVWYFGTKGTRDMWPMWVTTPILNGPRYKGLVRRHLHQGASGGGYEPLRASPQR
jgi:phytoene desaturase